MKKTVNTEAASKAEKRQPLKEVKITFEDTGDTEIITDPEALKVWDTLAEYCDVTRQDMDTVINSMLKEYLEKHGGDA